MEKSVWKICTTANWYIDYKNASEKKNTWKLSGQGGPQWCIK